MGLHHTSEGTACAGVPPGYPHPLGSSWSLLFLREATKPVCIFFCIKVNDDTLTTELELSLSMPGEPE